MRIVFIFLATAITALAQTNSIHTWTLKSGASNTGDYFTSGALAVVIKSHGTNCILKISDLTTNDWLYFQDCKSAQRQHQLDAEAAQMSANGLMQFNSDLIENFPEKVNDRYGWMDGQFQRLDSLAAGFLDGGKVSDLDLGFDIRDNTGNIFEHAYVPKDILGPNFATGDNTDYRPNGLVSVVSSLKSGDRIRLIGHVIANADDQKFEVQKVEIIQTAAEAAQIDAVRQEAGQ